MNLIKERITESDCENGFIFDGFPRTLAQAEALEKLDIGIDFVIEISASDEKIVERLSGRRVHMASGRVYHIKNNPPKVEGVDNATGEPLVHREDDKQGTIRKRLEVYHAQTVPLIDFYKQKEFEGGKFKYLYIDGAGEMNVVWADLKSKLET